MPYANTLHVDRLLSNISVKYFNSEYIASSVFPELPVEKESDRYRIFVRNFRIPETKRANKGLAKEHDFEVTTSSYILERHALKNYVSDGDAMNYDISSLRADMTEELTDKILQRFEKTVATLFTSTQWSQNVSLAATAAWTANTTVSNPIPIMDTAATTIIQNSGFKPNYAIMRRGSFIAAKNHVSVLDRIKYVSADVTLETMKGLFDLPEILLALAVEDTSNLGVADSISDIWNDNVFVGYKPARPSPMRPSAGYVFRRNKPMVKRWREEERESEAIEVNMEFTPKVVASLAGYLIKDVE